MQWNSEDNLRHCLTAVPTGCYRACPKCQGELDLAQGEWVADYPGREIHGYCLSQLFSPKVDPGEILREYRTTRFPDRFYNLKIGIPWVDLERRLDTSTVLALCSDACPSWKLAFNGYRPSENDRLVGREFGILGLMGRRPAGTILPQPITLYLVGLIFVPCEWAEGSVLRPGILPIKCPLAVGLPPNCPSRLLHVVVPLGHDSFALDAQACRWNAARDNQGSVALRELGRVVEVVFLL